MTFYQLVFATQAGTRRSFRVNHVEPGLSGADVRAAIDDIIAAGIMAGDDNQLAKLVRITGNTVSTFDPLAG